MNEPIHTANSLPDLSVLVPTHGRPGALERLVECLGRQSLPRDRFEVVIVDDGGSPAADVDPGALSFRCNILRQANAGPAAARNAGLALCRAPLVLMLNDDSVPSDDLLESHLRAHRELGPGQAVLGTFRFTANARRSAFTRLLDESDLLFGFSALTHGRVLSWAYFWTCNISVSREAILNVGGFDAERFDAAISEDVELGYRLAEAGCSVVYREDCRAEHEHTMTVKEYLRRASKLGKYSTRLAAVHNVSQPAWSMDPNENAAIVERSVNYIEGRRGAALSFVRFMEEMEQSLEGVEIPEELAQEAKSALCEHGLTYAMAGAYKENQGIDVLRMMEEGPPAGTTVGIVIVSCNALANTKRCIETLRAKADPRFPQVLYVTDNGSTDGSAEWLEGAGAGPDLKLIRNPFNYGAPRARNQALLGALSGAAEHAWIGFLDNDVFVTEGWLDRALYHGEVDTHVGSVSLCASRASKLQVVPYSGPDDQASLDAFANAHFDEDPRVGKDAKLFTSFGVLVRAEVLDQIGGFDEAFSPWGFEDDDLSLRIRMAGWRNRVARDTYVHHAAYGSQEKVDRHDEWMRANWETFLAKWAPAAAGSPLFDYSKVGAMDPTQVSSAKLRFDLPGADAPIPEWAGCSAERGPAQEPQPSRTPEGESPPAPVPRVRGAVPTVSTVSTGPLGAVVSDVLGSALLVPAGPRPGPGPGADADAGTGTSDEREPLGLGPDGPVFVVSPSAEAAARLARALGWNAAQDPTMRGLNEYLLAGTSLVSSGGLWMGDPLGEVPNRLDGAPATEVRAVLQPGTVHAEPRLAATLHAWLDFVPGARVVFVVSEPTDLVAELRASAASDPGCEGLEIDEGNALGLWLRSTQRALDLSSESRGGSQWTFVMESDLCDPSVQARLEASTGCSLRGSSALGSAPSEGHEAYPAVAAVYQVARARARGESPGRATAGDAPDLSVILDLSGPARHWGACLDSMGRQTFDPAGYEVVASCRDTESLDLLRERSARHSIRVLDARGMALGAARNAAIAEARGAYALFVDASTRPVLDLVEQHVIALTAAGSDRATRGATIPFGEAQGVALARCLAVLRTPTGTAGEEPEGLYEWPKFDSSNLCVSIEAMRSVGLFDSESSNRAYLDAELGFRLQAETGLRVVIAEGACTERLERATLAEWRASTRQGAGAHVRVVAEHPAALAQRDLRVRLAGTVDAHREMVLGTLDGRGRAEALACELAAVDVGSLQRAGEEGAEIAEVLVEALAEYLVELDALYRADGEIEAFQELGVTGFQELLERSRSVSSRAESTHPSVAWDRQLSPSESHPAAPA